MLTMAFNWNKDGTWFVLMTVQIMAESSNLQEHILCH